MRCAWPTVSAAISCSATSTPPSRSWRSGGGEGFWTARISVPAALAAEVAEKGSVAVDGVSLTVAALGTGWFEVALIPATLSGTTLDGLRAGDLVNLETDVLAKYVRRALGGERTGIEALLAGSGDAAD